MCSKKVVIKKIYEDILKDKKIFERLKSELSHKSQLDEAFICKHILPLAKKVDPEIAWQDILAYEKEALSQPTELTLNDLENISGGKASNVLMSFGLLALMGFSGLAASNVASADFIPFSETKEVQEYKAFKENPSPTEEDKKNFEFVDLGEVPFYLQADHMVDGLLWFKSPDEDKAFFVMDRKFENKNAVYTYSAEVPSQLNLAEKSINKPSFEEIQKQEFKLFNINELEDYLQESFRDADKTKFNPITHKDSQTLQLADDNPLYNFSRFYNKDYDFNEQSEIKPEELDLPSEKFKKLARKNFANISMFASKKTPGFETIKRRPSIQLDSKKEAYAKKLSDSIKNLDWSIAHRTPPKENAPPNFSTIESTRTLTQQKEKKTLNNGNLDSKILRHDGFTFFTLQVGKKTIASFLLNGNKLFEKQLPFEKIPIVSCSKYMVLNALKEDVLKECPVPALRVPTEACFNGSSEEVKDQIAIYYINKLYDSLENKDDFNEKKLDSHVEDIKNMIHDDELEIRIPTHVAVDKWEEVDLT